jgi:chitodextrinase
MYIRPETFNSTLLMKKNFFQKWGLLCLAIFAFTNLTAQEFSSERERMNAMMAEEAKIQAYIDEHISDELPEAVNVFVDELLKHDHDDDFHSEATPEEEQRLKQQVRRKYFRHLYLRENPQAAALFQPAALANCLNGDFEMGDFTSYGAASGLRGSSVGDCDVASILFSPEPPQTTETVSAGAGINCEIVTVGPDPLIPSLPRVRSGSFAARINQTNVSFGINQITKKVVLTQPNEDLGFWFSLVMQNPNGHNNRQPFFKARALDPLGNVLDEVCEFADAFNPFFGSTTISGQGLVVYSPYFCQTLELAGNIGDTITLEISTADCGAGAHWGYSYIDDICDVCTVDSCNYQGDINLDPTDTCSDITQVCGTYNLAALNCTTSTVHDLTLGIYQGGVLINTLTGGTIDLVNQTFCFNISPADFLGNTGGFDFQANITFNINGAFNSESDLNTNPGTDNDYITDPACCPEFEVLDCCTYWSLPSVSGARSADGAVADRKIQEVLTEYREQIQAKYGKSVSETDCNPCEFPNDQFPIFIVDENNMLIDDTQYNITWSHNPGWTAAYSWISPNQQTIVTVTDPNDSACSWTDTFYYECCDLDVEIVPLCTTCDPCSNPGQPFFLAVEDQNGNPLSTTGYSFLWSTGSMASGINGVVNTVYTVTVTELATGCMSTDTFSIVCCKCDIKADFDFDIQKCKVEFKDQSSLDTCNTIVSYAWDFGDGATGTGVNPTHTYAANGTYLACLVVTATNGAETCSDTICKKVDIQDCDTCPCELKPDFRFDIDRCDVKFESDAGAGSCTQVTSYFWDFGDGNTSTAMNPTHTYAANGSYTVCLTVEGTNGTDICKEKICYQV